MRLINCSFTKRMQWHVRSLYFENKALLLFCYPCCWIRFKYASVGTTSMAIMK